MPASASPAATLPSDRLHVELERHRRTVTPALSSAWRAYLPAGTEGSASTTFRPGRARSARPLIRLRVPWPTAIWPGCCGRSRRRVDQAGAHQAAHGFLVGGGHHVGRCAGPDLGHQLLGAGEAEGERHAGMGGRHQLPLMSLNGSVSEAAAKTVREPVNPDCEPTS